MALWVSRPDWAPMTIMPWCRKLRTAAHSAKHTVQTLESKCHMCSATLTETTAMGWDSLTHAQSAATESDSGWHLERLEFTANSDKKDSWLARSLRSGEQSWQKHSGNMSIRANESLFRGPVSRSSQKMVKTTAELEESDYWTPNDC